jgi:hypothetical protein
MRAGTEKEIRMGIDDLRKLMPPGKKSAIPRTTSE